MPDGLSRFRCLRSDPVQRRGRSAAWSANAARPAARRRARSASRPTPVAAPKPRRSADESDTTDVTMKLTRPPAPATASARRCCRKVVELDEWGLPDPGWSGTHRG